MMVVMILKEKVEVSIFLSYQIKMLMMMILRKKLRVSILSFHIKDPISPTSFGANPRIHGSTCRSWWRWRWRWFWGWWCLWWLPNRLSTIDDGLWMCFIDNEIDWLSWLDVSMFQQLWMPALLWDVWYKMFARSMFKSNTDL